MYPMYKAFIEPDLKAAHLRIYNTFNPFSGFMRPTYILKSSRKITKEDVVAVLQVLWALVGAGRGCVGQKYYGRIGMGLGGNVGGAEIGASYPDPPVRTAPVPLQPDYTVKARESETYDIYLVPPGEDPETCQSWLRMRYRDGRYTLMFEEWVVEVRHRRPGSRLWRKLLHQHRHNFWVSLADSPLSLLPPPPPRRACSSSPRG